MVEDIVSKLKERKETLAAMEACTGGAIIDAITNIEGSSSVVKFSAVTYSNDYKVRLGVDRKVMEEHSVFSIHTARQMAFRIAFFAESTYGIGTTGRFNKPEENLNNKKSNIYVSIYNTKTNLFSDMIIKCPNKRREKCKEYVVKKIITELLDIIK